MKTKLFISLAVLCLLAVQANAGPYNLDVPTARTFTQLSPPLSTPGNYLQLVIDKPGLQTSTTYFTNVANPWIDPDGAGPELYGEPMMYQVGFAGHVTGYGPGVNTLFIGTQGNLTGFDSLVIPISNDNDDLYRYTAWVSYDNMLTTNSGSNLDLIGGTVGTISVALGIPASGAPIGSNVTHFGFSLDLLDPSSDDFHTSVVPLPGAVLLGILGLGAAGLKLRKYA